MTTIELPLKALIEEIKSLPSLGYKIVQVEDKKNYFEIAKSEDEREEVFNLDHRIVMYLIKHLTRREKSLIKKLPEENIKLLKKIPRENFYTVFTEKDGEEIMLLEIEEDDTEDEESDSEDDEKEGEKENKYNEKEDENRIKSMFDTLDMA